MRILDWLDDRTGYRAVLDHALEEPVRGGASFAYVFGSVLTFILLTQMVTGVFLAMYYSPSATDAWSSVAHIQDTVTMGWFVRGLHSYGASAMVIVCGLHLLQVAIWGAYKKPREVNWILGVLLLGLVLAFALTGYLLPWDQKGYWATKVATGIAGSTPVAGQALQEAVQGGNEYGNLTLTRFFAIHVFLLPAATIALVLFHVGQFRRHGVTPRWGQSEAELARKVQPFWPDQLFRDVVAMAVCFAVMVGLVIAGHGVGLDAPADPSSSYDARPEWYFRALFQMLKYFEGSLENVVALGMPVVVGGVLLALPFVDRGADHSPRRRAGFLAVVIGGIIGVAALTIVSYREDAADAKLGERIEAAEKLALKARRLARENGVPAAGGVAVYTTAPFYLARKIWSERCASCHEGKERKAPVVEAGYNGRPWIRAFLQAPSGPAFFGTTKIDEMDPVELSGADLDAIVEMVYAETGAKDVDTALAEKGRTLFDDGDCGDCHERTGTEPGTSAPNLAGRGSLEMLVSFIGDAGQPRFFGEMNDMTKLSDELTAEELRAVAEYVVWLRDASPEDVAKLDM
jgi:ubiquinol-cytochrome c reductase cytochrome b subunit